MPSAQEVIAAFERHRMLFNDARREEWLDNFVDVPFLEEPVGTMRRKGREHLAEVFDSVWGAGMKAVIEEPSSMIVGGDELAVSFTATTTGDFGTVTLPIIEIFTIADDGRVQGIRAFVDLSQLPA